MTEPRMLPATQPLSQAGAAERAHQKRILFVETTRGTGGSVTNVLYPMVRDLDRTRFTPTVLFYWPNPYQEKIQAAGVETMLFDRPTRPKHPGALRKLQAEAAPLVNNLREERSRWRELYHGVGSYLYVGYAVPQLMRLARQMRASGADLVHLNRDHGAAGRLVILAAKLAGLPVLCYAQNFSEFFAADRHIARYVDRYVFCSNAIGQHCLTHGGVRASQSATIYPGVADTGKWSQSYDTAQVRQSLGWTSADFVVGCIGRLVPWKGQEVFLRALAEAKRHVPAVKGLVVGGESRLSTSQPSYFERLRVLSETLGLTENVHFTGYRTDIPPLMASVDVLVHSSVEPEPFATTVIEGMMAARSVVATHAGGMPEMIAEGVTGRLVPPRDPQAMAEAILDYYRDPARARRMGLAAQQAALSRLTAERHVAEFQALYEAIFARSEAGHAPHS